MTKIEKFEKVRALVRSGVSQSEAARQVGVGHATASRWCADLPRPQRAPKPEREPAIALTAEQRRNARDILNRLAGGQIEEPRTRRKRLSDELVDEQRESADYIPHGLEITDEVIAEAHSSVDWRAMLGATRRAHEQLRCSVQRALENAEARARYIRGEYKEARQPRANDHYAIGVVA